MQYTLNSKRPHDESEGKMKYDELKDEIKAAMKAKDKVRLSILRQVHG